MHPVAWVTPLGDTRYDLLTATQIEQLGAATFAEWEEARNRGHAHAVATARHVQAKADAQRYGIAGHATRADPQGGTRVDTVYLVRTTPTQIVGAAGKRWARRTGRPIRGSGAYGALTTETMAAVEARADGRQIADFIADGKQAPCPGTNRA